MLRRDGLPSEFQLERQRRRRMTSQRRYRVRIRSSRYITLTGDKLERLLADELHEDDGHDLDVRAEQVDWTGDILGVAGIIVYGTLALGALAGIVWGIASAV